MDALEGVSVLSSHVAHVEEERLKRTLRERSRHRITGPGIAMGEV
ncbi:hypothetical protein [Nitrosospira sp. Nsp14]|nr:hypothetical protein [Nitrosospira sp. Nsp14]